MAAQASTEPGPFNVGTGVETSVLDLAGAIGRIADRDDFEPEFAPPREGEVQRTALSTEASAQGLGWRASRELEPGLEQTLDAQ